MILYHASSNKNLKQITPQPTKSNDILIGSYVFATENLLLATMYLANKGVAVMMNPEKENPTIVICSDSDSYIKNDVGGAIYELSSNSFKDTPQKDLSEFEKVSEIPVEPINFTAYSSSLDAIQKAGIKIYFVDEVQFNNLINNPKQKEIISKLSSYNF